MENMMRTTPLDAHGYVMMQKHGHIAPVRTVDDVQVGQHIVGPGAQSAWRVTGLIDGMMALCRHPNEDAVLSVPVHDVLPIESEHPRLFVVRDLMILQA